MGVHMCVWEKMMVIVLLIPLSLVRLHPVLGPA